MEQHRSAAPAGHRTVTPYLLVRDARALIEFVERAFDGEVVRRWDKPDGTVRHAEVRIGDSRIMLADANEKWPPMPAMVHLYVDDADAVHRRALAAGATSIQEPEDMPYGDRSGGVRDACGNLWWLATRVEDLTDEEIVRRAALRDASAAGRE